MSNDHKHRLIKELQGEGASAKDAAALAGIAASLSQLRDHQPQPTSGRWSSVATGVGTMVFGGAVVAVAVLAIVTFSLRSLPGQLLHPVKAAAESVAVAVDPSLQTAVMMDKSREVAALTARHRPATVVLAALNSYNYSVGGLRGSDHYAAWQYCANQLTRASAQSSGATKSAIDRSLKAIPKNES